MKPFMDENFLLNSKAAMELYHEHAQSMPLLDYHCHLSPMEIATDKRYANITEIWLGGDHYKWRAMRTNGVDEKYITGSGSDKEKFFKWAETMPYCIGNPLYHWTHLELKRFFGIDEVLSPKTAEEIWGKCNRMLQGEGFSARELIKRSNVKTLCTTDDPVDSLDFHKQLAADKSFQVTVLPAFRPDKCINIEKDGFAQYILKLGEVAGIEINSMDRLQAALKKRIEFFYAMGCRISDHALDQVVYAPGTESAVDEAFKKAMVGRQLSGDEIQQYKTQVLLFLAREYHSAGWAMQLHIGALRNNNARMLHILGPDTGYDAIGDDTFARSLSRFLDALASTDQLPKTVLYCLNPRDNEVLGAMAGCFQEGGIPGKVQFGSGWWFNDQKTGMKTQITALANLSLISRFIGMTTDSRSFLSYTRHEYFRRILCNLIGGWIEEGEAPGDMALLGQMVRDISYNNAKKYFEI